MKYINIRNNLNIIKKLVFILILFVFGLIFITNVKADPVKEAYLLPGESFFSYFNFLSILFSFRRPTLSVSGRLQYVHFVAAPVPSH